MLVIKLPDDYSVRRADQDYSEVSVFCGINREVRFQMLEM